MKFLIVAALVASPLAFGCTAESNSSVGSNNASVPDTPSNTAPDTAPDTAPVVDTVATVDGGEAKTDSSGAMDVSISETSPDAAPDVAVDTAPEQPEGLPPGVQGKEPPGATALPQFAAVVDQNGEKVGPERLVGPWTVIWFYPKASTGG